MNQGSPQFYFLPPGDKLSVERSAKGLNVIVLPADFDAGIRTLRQHCCCVRSPRNNPPHAHPVATGEMPQRCRKMSTKPVSWN